MVEAAPRQPHWWLQPRFVVLFVGFAPLFLSTLVSHSSYVVLYGTDKHLGTDFVVASALVFGAFLLASTYQQRPRTVSFDDALRFAARFERPLMLVAISGYGLWFVWGYVVADSDTFWRTLNQLILHRERGAADSLRRELLVTPAGITALTQVGVVGVMMQAALRGARQPELMTTGAGRRLLLLFALVTFRAVFLVERLSLIETAVAGLVVFALVRSWYGSTPASRSSPFRYVPVVSALGVAGLFAFAEYFRSWAYYEHHFAGGYAQFIFQRLLGYYATALNNGALIFDNRELWAPGEYTFALVTRIPGARSFFFGDPSPDWNTFLITHANPEFNNPSGVGLWLQDFGVIGAMTVGVVSGLALSYLLTRAAEGSPPALFVFPVLYVGLIELPRVYYWVDGRTAPIFLALALSWLIRGQAERWRPLRHRAAHRAGAHARDLSYRIASASVSSSASSSLPPPAHERADATLSSPLVDIPARRRHVIFASHADWESAFRVGSHHRAAAFARLGHEVLHLSAPQLGWSHRRGPESAGPERDTTTGVWVWQPASLVPGRLPGRDDWLRHGILPNVERVLSDWGFANPSAIYIDYVPYNFLTELLSADCTVYRPTDLYGVGYRRSVTTRRMERRLLPRVQGVVATSRPVAERVGAIAPHVPTMVLRNGVDLEHFSQPRPAPRVYEDVGGPIALYVGAIDRRFAVDMVEASARRLPDVTFVLAGPITIRWPGKPSNVRVLGAVPYGDVPAFMQHADVGLIPLNDDAANEGRSPMKLYEYLAAGLPVVATRTPELDDRHMAGVTLAAGARDFADGVGAAISQDAPILDTALVRRDWTHLAVQLLVFTRLVTADRQ